MDNVQKVCHFKHYYLAVSLMEVNIIMLAQHIGTPLLACDVTFLAMKLRQIFPISKGTICINQQMVQCIGYLQISI
jgi:hypothetical protein